MSDLLNVEINSDKCVGCGLCVQDCVAQNIRLTDGKAEAVKECFACGHCVAICPAGAVAISEYPMDEVKEYEKDSFCLNPEHVLNHIKFRRSVRDYKEKKIPGEELEQLLQAGRYTATAKNNQDCYFVFVQEETELLKEKVWEYIEKLVQKGMKNIEKDMLPYVAFRMRKKANPEDDYLFRNAPAVLFITSDWPLDAGLAAQNVETMAVSMGLGVLYNGFLSRIADADEELKQWLGIEGKQVKACMLLGYPSRLYQRTAPRKEANVIWK